APNAPSEDVARVRPRRHLGKPGDLPNPPKSRRVTQRIAVHEEEVRGTTFDDSTGFRLAQELSALDRRGHERLRRLQPGLDERLDLPREVVRAKRPAADPDPGPGQETRMRGHLRPATVREVDDGPHVFRRPGRLLFLRSVEVELEEVRPILELGRRGLQEGRAVIRLDQEATRYDAA